MGRKVYLSQNVYDATQDRLKYIFDNFDNVYLSFSGGKDSSLMFNLVIKYIVDNNIKKKVTILFIDLEAFYKLTIHHVEELIELYKDYINVYWICLPFSLRNAVSVYQPKYICWDEEDKNIWVRDMPKHKSVINIGNLPAEWGFFYKGMEFEEFIVKFAEWISKDSLTACLVGIRSDESLNRFRTIASETKESFNNVSWTTKITNNCYNAYPIYDWSYKDLWHCVLKNSFKYNNVYDLFYKSRVPFANMRLCQPFGDDQRLGLDLYRVVEPETWEKLINRVSGANFGNIYCGTKALGYNKAILPKNYTWKKYTKYLLETLPEVSKKQYIKKFLVYIKYWSRNGSATDDNIINELKKYNYNIKTNGISSRGNKDKKNLVFKHIPDSIDELQAKQGLCWKRMAWCILKNDWMCKSLGFAQTKTQIEAQKKVLDKYKNL